MTAESSATRSEPRLAGWAGFWLWALVGAAVVLGVVYGVGLPLLAVAVVQWHNWQHRVVGDGTPNPYYWGGVGLLLLAAGVVPFAALRSHRD